MALRRSSVDFDLAGLARQTARLDRYSSREMQTLLQRAAGTLTRRLPVEASRLVSGEILNVPRLKVRPLLSAKSRIAQGEVAVVLSGARGGVPLHQFVGAKYGGRKTAGAVVKIWRDAPAKVYDRRASRSDTAVFAGAKRGVRAGLFQRIHNRKGERAPVVLRKGPGLWRAITDRDHGDIYPQLIGFGRDVLRAEIARLTRIGRR